MARIQILPEILSNKIAAGEVVERPASVVKELVENAIDAAGDRIHIDIEQGGRALIRVSDNGCGMGHDDALLAIERYATSKIATESDLFDIRTLGFRGEALPSIAAVSKFSLVTRDESSAEGTEIRVEGGRVVSVNPTGAPKGTMITVRQLFFNTPARRKFLKTIPTELGHIAETVSSIALSRPDLAFRLTHDGKIVKDWHAAHDPLDRATDILGEDLHRRLYAIFGESDAVSVAGWVGDPSVTRGTSGRIYIFVNGRYIRDRGINYALMDGYRGRLMKGRFPVAVLHLKLPPDEVDINVHPTKHEVRFFRQREVYAAVRTAVENAWNTSRPAQHSIESRQALPAFETYIPPAEMPLSIPEAAASRFTVSEPPAPDFRAKSSWSGRSSARRHPQRRPSPATAPAYSGNDPARAPLPEQPAIFELADFASLSVIGQFHRTYILCEQGDDLLLIDQHAAHERILYERFRRTRQSGTAPSVQKLLIPETIELGYREVAVLERMLPELNNLGMEIEHFGGNTFVVKSVPDALADRQLSPLITEMAEAAGATGYTPGLSEAIDRCIMLMACHGAIRAHQNLSAAEMKALVTQLDDCENPWNCPHGRPTVIRWPVKLLEKHFKRIV